jgi:hypothetical protein
MALYTNEITLKGFLGKSAESFATKQGRNLVVLSLATKSGYKDKQTNEWVNHTARESTGRLGACLCRMSSASDLVCMALAAAVCKSCRFSRHAFSGQRRLVHSTLHARTDSSC